MQRQRKINSNKCCVSSKTKLKSNKTDKVKLQKTNESKRVTNYPKQCRKTRCQPYKAPQYHWIRLAVALMTEVGQIGCKKTL